MRLKSAKSSTKRRFWTPDLMREELSHALVEALYELEVLPEDADGAVVGLYAIMDDLRDAIDRTEGMDELRAR